LKAGVLTSQKRKNERKEQQHHVMANNLVLLNSCIYIYILFYCFA
jgi:hypothetical protein